MVRTEGKLSEEKALDLTEGLAVDFSTRQDIESEKFCDHLAKRVSEVSEADEMEIFDECVGPIVRKFI